LVMSTTRWLWHAQLKMFKLTREDDDNKKLEKSMEIHSSIVGELDLPCQSHPVMLNMLAFTTQEDEYQIFHFIVKLFALFHAIIPHMPVPDHKVQINKSAMESFFSNCYRLHCCVIKYKGY